MSVRCSPEWGCARPDGDDAVPGATLWHGADSQLEGDAVKDWTPHSIICELKHSHNVPPLDPHAQVMHPKAAAKKTSPHQQVHKNVQELVRLKAGGPACEGTSG